VKSDYNDHYTAIASEAQAAFERGNAKLVYKLINELSDRKPSSLPEVLKDNAGGIVASDDGKRELLKDHFSTQFSFPGPSEPELDSVHWISEQESPDVAAPSDFEIMTAIKNLKLHKAAGPDNIPAEALKTAPIEITEELCSLIRKVWDEKTVPSEWTASSCVPVFKKGDSSLPSNYRGINLIPVVTKVLEAIIASRLATWRQSTAREQQSAFRPGRGCVDHLFVLRQIIETRAVEFNEPTICVFLDLKGAFDSVDRPALLNCLLMCGVPEDIVDVIRALYTGQSMRVKAFGGLSSEFEPNTGVWQGGVLSPLLFTILMDTVVNEMDHVSDDSGLLLSTHEGPDNLSSLEYADDIVLLGDNYDSLQNRLNVLSTAASRYGLVFAPHKCNVLCIGDRSQLDRPLTLYNDPLPFVDKIVYLGSVFSSSGSHEPDIERRLTHARQVMGRLWRVWNSNKLNLSTKARIYETCVRSVMLYGCEPWALRNSDCDSLSTLDNRNLRWLTKTKWYDRISNKQVQRMCFGARAPAVGDITEIVKRRQLRWLGHVARMPQERLPARIMKLMASPEWRRGRGRPKLVWRKYMTDNTEPFLKNQRGRPLIEGRINVTRSDYKKWLTVIRQVAAERSTWRAATEDFIGNRVCSETAVRCVDRAAVSSSMTLRSRVKRRL
jgi:hypothetical protein